MRPGWRQLELLKGPRQRGTRPPRATEFATHCAVADTIRVSVVDGWIWTHFPAGEERPSFINKHGKRVSPAADRLKRMGLNPGFLDLLFISPVGIHHWLELKRGNAELTDAQEHFFYAMQARGVPVAIARSFNEAIDVLKRWGVVRVSVSI